MHPRRRGSDGARRAAVARGHLVLFDRAADKPWSEKLFRREEQMGTHRITVWGM